MPLRITDTSLQQQTMIFAYFLFLCGDPALRRVDTFNFHLIFSSKFTFSVALHFLLLMLRLIFVCCTVFVFVDKSIKYNTIQQCVSSRGKCANPFISAVHLDKNRLVDLIKTLLEINLDLSLKSKFICKKVMQDSFGSALPHLDTFRKNIPDAKLFPK